jgi:hypothetical protein
MAKGKKKEKTYKKKSLSKNRILRIESNLSVLGQELWLLEHRLAYFPDEHIKLRPLQDKVQRQKDKLTA